MSGARAGWVPAARDTLMRAAVAATAPVRPLTRWIRTPIRWVYHRSPVLRHDVKPSPAARILHSLHALFVGDLPEEFGVHGGRIRFHSSRSAMAIHGYYVGEIEYHLSRFVLDHLAPGFVMVDVGAHHGIHALVVAYELRARELSGHVHAFEPDPWNRHILRQNLERNELLSFVTVHEEAVSDRQGEAELLVMENESSGHTLRGNEEFAVWAGARVTPRVVPTTSLDALLDGLPRVSLIKIDVQGAEPLVLAGAQRLIARDRPVLVVEAVPGWPSTPRVREMLEAWEYRVMGLDREGRPCPIGSRAVFVSWDWVATPEERVP